MKRGRLPQQLVLGPQEVAKVLTRLASTDAPGSQELYARLMGSWGNRPDRAYITFRPTSSERLVLRQIPLPAKVVQSTPRFVAVYRCDSKPDVEVILRTTDRPPRKRKLKVTGGTRRFTLIKLYQHKESTMAKGTKTKGTTKAKTKAPDPVDELEAELEGLEEVEIEDEEEEDAPEVEEDEDEEEDEDDDEEQDYSTMKVAELKALCKERGIKGLDKQNKGNLIKFLKAADAGTVEGEAEEDDDEEEDDGLDEMDRAALKARMTELGLGKAKKSQSDDDLRALIREATADEDEEEEDDEEEEEDEGPDFDSMSRAELKAHIKAEGLPVRVTKSMSDDDIRAAITGEGEEEDEAPAPKKASGKGKGKSTGKGKGKQPSQLVRQLPAGKLGANDIAEMAGTKALNVRNFLRNNKTKFPKNEELGRYAFTEKQARAIVAAMKKGGNGKK